MTLKQDQSMMINKLKYNINLLKNYSGRSKSEILENAVHERLNKSLNQYYTDLNKSLERLSEYNETHNLKMMKKLNKD